MQYVKKISLFVIACLFFAINQANGQGACSSAVLVTVDGACGSGTASDGTVNDAPLPSCATILYDTWFKFVATSTNAIITGITTNRNQVIQVFSGTCASLTEIGCANAITSTGAQTETVSLTGLTISNTYYIRVANTTNNSNMSITSLCVTSVSYCTFSNTYTSSYYINNFSTTGGTTNITNNGSGFSTNGYGNYTAMTVTQTQSSSVNFSITSGNGTMGYGIWVDWNQDGDFADAGEQVYITSSAATSVTGSFTVPASATPGNTRMRVVGDWMDSYPSSACGTDNYSEVEDYTFIVGTPCGVTAVTVSGGGTVCPNTTLTAANGGSGTIYYQGTTSGGTSTATPSTSQLISASGTYYFRAYNGTCWGTQGSATVTIATSVSITTQPTDQSGCASANLTLTVVATGTSPTYQWQYYNGTTWNNVANGTPTGATYTNATTAAMTATGISVNGTFPYRCVVSNACGSVNSNTANIVIATPTITGTTPGSVCGVGTVTLGATGSAGSTLNWYAASSGGSSLGTGTSFTTPSISSTTNYYVSAGLGGGTIIGGRPAPTGTSTTDAYGYGLVFDATQAFTLQSVEVYSTGAGNVVVELQNSSGTMLQTATCAVIAGGTSTPQTLTLNFNIPVGTGYRLIAISSPYMVRESSLGGFPYSLGANGSITGGYISGASTTYYYFYNWIMGGGSCESARSTVTATVTAAPALALDVATATICSGTSTVVNVTPATVGNYSAYSWSPSSGASPSGTPNGATVTLNPTTNTTYTVTGTGGGCTKTASVDVSLTSPPSAITITPSAPNLCAGGIQTLVASGGTLAGSFLNESFSGSSLPAGWATQIGSGDAINVATTNNAGGTANEMNFAGGSFSSVTSRLYYGPINTSGQTSLTLQWNNYVDHYSSSYAYSVGVQTSSNGTTWTNTSWITNPVTADIGPGVQTATINTADVGSSTFYIAFTMNGLTFGNNDWYIDNVLLTGTSAATTLTWSPTATLYTNAAATIAYTGTSTNTIYAKPASTTTYTATASAGGCTTTQTVTVNISPLACNAITTGGGSACAGTQTVTAHATGGGDPYSYSWKENGVAIGGNTASINTNVGSNTYSCTITDNCGTTCASSLVVSTTALPNITTQPVAATILAGNTATYSVVASGTPTYQWQYATSTSGPWANVINNTPVNVSYNNATSATLSVITGGSTSTGSSHYYRCIVTSGGCASTSNSAQLTITTYCTSSATSTSDMDIDNVTFGTINNTGSCGSLTGSQGTATGTAYMYSNWRGSTVPVPSCMQGSTYPISVSIPTCGTAYGHAVYVFIDFNQDGDFVDAGESTTIFAYANPGAHVINSNITIPITATIGNTVMRVLCVESSSFSAPCGTYTWGETEDYTINIVSSTPCSGLPAAANALASPSSITSCAALSTTLSLSTTYNFAGITYQWQSASASTGPWTSISGATGSTYATTIVANKWFRCIITCNGTSSTTSSSVQVTTTVSLAANDDCVNAEPLTLGTILSGDNTCSGSTGEPGAASCWTTGTLNTVWYSVVAPASGQIKIRTTLGSIASTQIAVYSGTCGSLTQVTGACSQTAPTCGSSSYNNSELTVTGLTSGTTYYIRVDGRNDAIGTFNITVIDATNTLPPIPGQDCASVLPVCNATMSIGNPGYQAIGNLCDFGGSYCLASGERGSVWYEITTTTAGNLMFTIEPNDVIPSGPGTLTSYGTDYDFAIWKKSGSGAVTCAQISAGTATPLACNYSGIGVTGLYTGGNTPPSNSYTSHTYPSGAYDAAFEPPLALDASSSYWLVINNHSNSTSGFSINYSTTTAGVINYTGVSSVTWTGGAASTSWTNSLNWGSCSAPSCAIDATVTSASAYQPIISGTVEVRDLTINPGSTLTLTAGSTLKVCGSITNNGMIVASPTSTILFNDDVTTHQLTGNFVGTSKLGNLTITDVAGGTNCTLTINNSVDIGGNFTTSTATSIFNSNGKYITVDGNFINSSGNTTFSNTGSTGTLEFNGAAAQTFTQGSSQLDLNNVVMNNSSTGLTLLTNMYIKNTGVLSLTNGVMNTGAFRLEVANSAASAVPSGNASSYINGYLRRYFTSNTNTYSFPMGNSASYRLAQIVNNNVTGIIYFDAFFLSPFTNTGSLNPVTAVDAGSIYSTICSEGIWQITPDANPTGGNYAINLWFDGGGTSPFAGIVDNRFGPVKRANSSTLASDWTALGGTLNTAGTAGRTVAGGYARRNGWTTFSQYAIALSSFPLPVELIQFSGECSGNSTVLTWVTQQEINNDYFTVERSMDGTTFIPVGTVSGQINSADVNSYVFTDDQYNPAYAQSRYYRLKQTDLDGRFTYSETIVVHCTVMSDNNEIVIINVDGNDQIIVKFPKENQKYRVTITDNLGRSLLNKSFSVSELDNEFVIQKSALGIGMYHIVIFSDTEMFSKQIIISSH